MRSPRRFDVAVAGAGPAGSATAIALALSGRSVAIFNAGTPRRLTWTESVPPDIEPLLMALGAGNGFLDDGHIANLRQASVWGADELRWSDGFARLGGRGWHLNRSRFDTRLLLEAERRGVAIIDGRMVDPEPADGLGWTLAVRHTGGQRQAFRARFLVDATGRGAGPAGRCGARRHTIDRLVGVSTVIDGAQGLPPGQSVIEAVEHGWWWAAGRPDGRAAVTLFSDGDLLIRHRALSPQGWHRMLKQTGHAFRLLGNGSRPSALHAVAAGSHCLQPLAGEGWLAVGDAATSWDPLSAAGATHALRSGLEAGAALRLLDEGDTTAVPRYRAQVERRFSTFVVQQRWMYAQERRWPTADFWRRRTGAAGLPRLA